ncbi:hypothetical protein GCM10018952_26150 [Streptosporangium vulgare]
MNVEKQCSVTGVFAPPVTSTTQLLAGPWGRSPGCRDGPDRRLRGGDQGQGRAEPHREEAQPPYGVTLGSPTRFGSGFLAHFHLLADLSLESMSHLPEFPAGLFGVREIPHARSPPHVFRTSHAPVNAAVQLDVDSPLIRHSAPHAFLHGARIANKYTILAVIRASYSVRRVRM